MKYSLILPAYSSTNSQVIELLQSIGDSVMPFNMALGIEMEGGLYDINGCHIEFRSISELDCPSYQEEYMSSTLELVTSPVIPNTQYDFASTVAQNVSSELNLLFERIAQTHAMIVFASTFESGKWSRQKLSPSIQSRLTRFTRESISLPTKQQIPNLTANIYRFFEPRFDQIYKKGNLLPWPVHAIHVHSQLPDISGHIDSRIAATFVRLRNSVAAKIMSFVLFNTNTALNQDLSSFGINSDVRAALRRLSSGSWGFFNPSSADELYLKAQNIIQSEENDSIRLAYGAMHERVRLRLGRYATVESIDGSMTCDLRRIFAWIFFNRIIDIVGLEALYESNGNEIKAWSMLESRLLFQILPTNGETYSAISWDRQFNIGFWDAIAPGMNRTFRSIAEQLIVEFDRLASRWAVIRAMCVFSRELLKLDLSTPDSTLSFIQYFGIDKGKFHGGMCGKGPITIRKRGMPLNSLLKEQQYVTAIQARAFSEVRDSQDLMDFL